MAKNKITLPTKSKEIISSYKIDQALHEKVKAKLKSQGQTIHALIEISFKSYLGEK